MTDLKDQRRSEALAILTAVGMPRAQQNDRSAYTLLALVNVSPEKQWADAEAHSTKIHDIIEWIAEHYGLRYAENSRETIRRQTLHQMVHAALIEKNPGEPERPINSPKTVYRVTPAFLQLLKTYGTREWEPTLKLFLAESETLQARYGQERERNVLEVTLSPGITAVLSAGGQNPLIKQIVEEFVPQFIQQPHVLYIGDAKAKQGHVDADALRALNVTLDRHGQMPDVIVHDAARNWLVLIEAVTSHGPMNPKRVRELRELFADVACGLVLVTAFSDRRKFSKYQSEIAWETEVWIAAEPTHLIHYDGERFLGPY